MDVKELDILGDSIGSHWYYSSKAAAMSAFLGHAAPREILDVGAGSAFFSRYLLARTSARKAWCIDISYEADSDAVAEDSGKPIAFRRAPVPCDADLLLFMDVLEHVDDDVALLREFVSRAPAKSRFLMTVPAFRFLWSDHDVFLEHKRRYTLHELESVARQAGLTVTAGAYYFGAVFPLAAALRLLHRCRGQAAAPRSQLQRHSPVVNGLLKTLCRAELPFMRHNRLFGLSVFCLAEKP